MGHQQPAALQLQHRTVSISSSRPHCPQHPYRGRDAQRRERHHIIIISCPLETSLPHIGDEETIIASVVESRSREVAIAVMSSRHLYILRVYLLTDTQSYSETIDLLEYLSPHEVIVPER